MANIIIGCGLYLPKKVLTNADIVEMLDGNTSDEWIVSRTGITERHIAEDDEYSSDMALNASLEAIKDANIDPKDIDLIVICTTTPDNTFPSTATKVQRGLGANSAVAFDVQAVCAGFIYGIHIVDSMMKSGNYNTALLVGVDKMSSILDFSDRSTSILFGDGAGAVILQKDNSESGILGSIICSDGRYTDILCTDGGVSSTQNAGVIKMSGPEVFKHATQKLTEISKQILDEVNMKISDVDYFIPHQANVRIIDYVASKLSIEDVKVVRTVDKHANCSAASIPLALAELKKSGKLKKGDIILMAAIGAGITWGASIIRN